MKTRQDWNDNDPLGLADLPLLEPDKDGWNHIRQALETTQSTRRTPRLAWLAVAAGLVLALVVTLQLAQRDSAMGQPGGSTDLADAATTTLPTASVDEVAPVEELIALSQMLEVRLRGLRDGTGALPGQSAVYVAELEDMVAQVDGELSLAPESLDLWGQRVNLLLDLEYIYQHQWEREYGRMASLN